ncbi:hypothetical protein Tco_0360662 [Tanacetum coccineum]
MTPRSCLRWKPTGSVFKNVVLRWVPTGKTFASSTTKVDSEPLNGSNADITNQCESEQALDVSAGTGNCSNKTECLPQIPEYVLCYALTELLAWKPLGFLFASLHTSLCHLSDGCDKTGILNDVPSEGGGLVCSARRVSIVPDHPEKFLPSKEAVYGFKNAQELWLR